MSARKPLPEIKACPRGKRAYVIETQTGSFRVFAPRSEWAGPIRYTKRAAILAWNRRSDEAAERSGAEAAVRWIEDAGLSVISKDLRRAFERGEVVGKRGRR